jgi:hypothetical protein
MPRAPHVALNLGPKGKNLGPQTDNRQAAEPREGGKTRTRSGNAGPKPAHEPEERILLVQGGAPAANLYHEPPLALALYHIGVLEAVQAAGVLEGGARRDGGGTAVPPLGSG